MAKYGSLKAIGTMYYNPDSLEMELIEPGRAYPDHHGLVRTYPKLFTPAPPTVRYGNGGIVPGIPRVTEVRF